MILPVAIFALTVCSIFLLPEVPQVASWDHQAVAWVAAHRVPWLTELLWVVTWWGGTEIFFIALLIPPTLYFINRRWGLGIYYLVGVGFIKLSVVYLKILVERQRPAEALELLKDLSMPSGHATNAVLIYGVLGMFCLREIPSPPVKWAAVSFCLVAIVLIDFSRIYLGVHFPSDIVMGSLYAAAGLWVLQAGRKKLFA